MPFLNNAHFPDTFQAEVFGCMPSGVPKQVQFNWTGGGWQSQGSLGGVSFFLKWNGDGTVDLDPSLPAGCTTDCPCGVNLAFGQDLTDPYNPVVYLIGLWADITVNASCCVPGAGGTLGISLRYKDNIPNRAPVCKCNCGCGKGGASGGTGTGGGEGYQTFGLPGGDRETSEGPIRYSTGEIVLSVDDLGSGGFGAPWGHTRSFSSQLGYNQDFGQGFNWQVAQWPSLKQPSGSTSMIVMGQASRPLWFDAGGSGYAVRHGLPYTFAGDARVGVYRLTGPDGSVTEFDRDTRLFLRHFDPAGNVTQVVSYAGFLPAEVQRSHTDSSGNTTVESFLYSYAQDAYSFDRVNSVTLRRQVNGGAWQNVRQALYAYYDNSSSFGWSGDLKTVVTKSWENGAWADLGTTLYRYWLPSGVSSSSSAAGSSSSSSSGASFSSSSSSAFDTTNTWGSAHLLKYVVNPASYAKLAADPNSGADPTTAPDWVVALYADNYFEYDGAGRAVREMLEGGSRSYTYSYSQSSFVGSADYNTWVSKTVETLPGGTTNTTYANFAGQVMLSVKTPGAGQSGNGPWYEFYRYDSSGRMILKAESSAITGYDETYADLLHCVSSGASSTSSGCSCPQLCSGYFQYLADHQGLIHLYDYDTASGNVIRERIRNGEFGCDNKLWERTYQAFSTTAAYDTPVSSSSSSSSSSAHTSSSSASGSSSGSSGTTVTRYLLTQSIAYPDDITVDPTQTKQIITSYSYTFFPGTVQVKSRTTTWPVVSTAQNGSGVADSRTEYFDVYGNPTWTKDERGYLTRQQYDPVTGGILQTIQDVDTSQTTDQPAGWATPSGGGLHLVTDYTVDNLGRTTQVLGPSHEIDLDGVATTIRRATWSVYLDSQYQQYSGQGYATGTAPSYTYTLVNPVGIAKFDQAGRVLEQISAIRSSTAGALSASDSFAQSSYCRWTTNQYTDCCKQASSRTYFAIPASGEGSLGVNYNETDFGYDFLNRRNRVVSPGGTITRTVFDACDLPIAIYVGTNDTGATASDPTGGGASGNNMVVVTEYQYDGGAAGDDGNLTQETQHVDATTSRVTSYGYDYRDRRIFTDGEIDFYQAVTYDNLNRTTQVDRHDTTASGNLVARGQTNYDDRGRPYQSIRYAVDPATGTVGNSLVDSTWYDPSGQVIKQLRAGSSAFTKSVYDGAGRQTVQYFGYDLGAGESNYASASDISDDTIVEQTETAYDAASNVVQTTFRQRYHDATGVGTLTYPGSAQPVARVSYVAMYPDAVGRPQATANYGTNGDVSFSRPSTIPTRADTVLVASILHNDRGEAYQTVDPAGRIDQTTLDDAGRKTQQVDNVVASSSSSSSSSSSAYSTPPPDDKNRTTLWTYAADGQIATLTAVNSATGNQVTSYGYGVSLPNSDVARNDALGSVTYSDGGVVTYLANRQGHVKQVTDQRQVVHQYQFDLLGRQVEDLVTSLGSSFSSSSSSNSSGAPNGVDGTVQRISRTYEVRGLLQNLTSFSTPVIGQGTVVNDVQRVYNAFGQLITEYQEHSGLVNTSSSVKVQYAYADGSANTIRPMSITYPNGRVLTYDYCVPGAADDALSRIASFIDDDGVTHLLDYIRLGRNTFVQQSSPQPQIAWSLVNGTGADPYTGLDQFNRIVDNRWYSTATSSSSSSSSLSAPNRSGTDLDRIQHGYDRFGNRLWRKNIVAEAAGVYLDELYSYDGLYRLGEMQSGKLNDSGNGIVSGTLDFAQAWGLDATGNWEAFLEDDTGSGNWNLNQFRTANQTNEITDIYGGGWVVPAYDAAGNMTAMPQPATPTSSYTGVYDAWNRLVSLSSSAETVGEYAYDGADRLTSSLVSATTRHFYFSAAWQVLEERLGASSAFDRQFIWGLRYVDNLVLRDSASFGRLYTLHDPHFSTSSLCDTTGTIRERYSYSAYGKSTFLTPTFGARLSSDYDWETLYAGYRSDSATSLYHVRHRVFNARVGLWTSVDALGTDTNLYLYCGAAPISLLDPSGQEARAANSEVEIIIGTIGDQFVQNGIPVGPFASYMQFLGMTLDDLKPQLNDQYLLACKNIPKVGFHCMYLFGWKFKCKCNEGIIQTVRNERTGYNKNGGKVKIDDGLGKQVDSVVKDYCEEWPMQGDLAGGDSHGAIIPFQNYRNAFKICIESTLVSCCGKYDGKVPKRAAQRSNCDKSKIKCSGPEKTVTYRVCVDRDGHYSLKTSGTSNDIDVSS